MDFLSDPTYDGITAPQLTQLILKDCHHLFIFIVDQTTFQHPEHPILVVDLHDELGRTFRVIPSEMWSVENNLSLANNADNVEQDGIFRGFSANAG